MVSDEMPSISPVSGSSWSELVRLARQVAEVRAVLVDVVDLTQHGAGAVGVADGQVGAGQLEQGLHRHDREGVGEQGPQPGRPARQVAGGVEITAAGRDTGGEKAYTSALVQ